MTLRVCVDNGPSYVRANYTRSPKDQYVSRWSIGRAADRPVPRVAEAVAEVIVVMVLVAQCHARIE